jgi:hypothetical protein
MFCVEHRPLKEPPHIAEGLYWACKAVVDTGNPLHWSRSAGNLIADKVEDSAAEVNETEV